MKTIIIHANNLNLAQSNLLETVFKTKPSRKNNHFRLQVKTVTREEVINISNKLKIDINILPKHFCEEQVKLVISDMDSTLIGIECIDEIADMMNLKPQVAAITEAAMCGEIDFAGSLKQRVSLLTDLKVSFLEEVYQHKLYLNKGTEQLINGLKQQNIKFALVSGGFTFFTERLQKQLKLDFTRANVLAEKNGKLTGLVEGNIIDAKAKAEFLHELCNKLNIKPTQVIAIGDGANDLLMMQEAGLSIAYYAKPAVQQQADISFNYTNLSSLLDFT